MDGRFGLGVIAILALAVIVGVLASRIQGSSVAAPAASVVPTQTALPPNGWVYMDHQSDGSAYFDPARLEVAVGQAVKFHNADTEDHSALADNGSFNTGVLSPGQNKSWVPTKAGTYGYGDFLHPEMHAVIVVR